MEKFQFVAYVLGAILSGWGIAALWHVASDHYYESQRIKRGREEREEYEDEQ